jgi:hypothetical protein
MRHFESGKEEYVLVDLPLFELHADGFWEVLTGQFTSLR